MNWSDELQGKLDSLTAIQRRAIERIVSAEVEGIPLSRLLKTSYSCRWCGLAVGRWSDGSGDRLKGLDEHESECEKSAGGKAWRFAANSSTFYGKWQKDSLFREALASAREEVAAGVLRESVALLQIGTGVALAELMRIIQTGEDDTNRRLAALGWLDRASGITAKKASVEIKQKEKKDDRVTDLLEKLRGIE